MGGGRTRVAIADVYSISTGGLRDRAALGRSRQREKERTKACSLASASIDNGVVSLTSFGIRKEGRDPARWDS